MEQQHDSHAHMWTGSLSLHNRLQSGLRLTTTSFVEHRSASERSTQTYRRLGTNFVLPGACTSCNGSSSTSCCNWD